MTAQALDHARALDLAAAAPPFTLDAAEARELHGHLRACEACARTAARMRTDAAAIGRLDPAISADLHDRLREVAVTAPRSGPSLFGLAAILVLLVAGVAGATIGVGAFLARPADPAPPRAPAVADDPADAVSWSTDVVALAATSLEIDADGLRFTGQAPATLSSDPGNLTSWTLESTWMEHGREQGMSLYFEADTTTWWIREIRVYDGSPNREAKWATFAGGPWAKTPLGATFEGDLQLEGSSATGPVKLHLGGLRIAVRPQDPITRPPGGGIKIPGGQANPFQPGGALRCSGILQLPPAEAELRLLGLGYQLSWRWQYSTGSNTGFAEARNRAPSTGWISDAAVGSSGELIVFVEDPARPMSKPAALPPECGAASPAVP